MSSPEWLPAAILITCFTLGVAAVRYLPFGETTVLVQIPSDDGAAIRIATMADALLVGSPGEGLALLHGDASAIRHVVGLAAVWNGRAFCETRL